jgi:class 3 adenylate cyclase/ketosteroid isomerase-like protein/tetratricopeptide (TPR) repeat protein
MAETRRTCASCGTTNEEDARFCEGCGGSLARVCVTCGVEASPTARFCRGCGAPLDGQVAQAQGIPAAGPARKTVTVMFADLVGSTSFEEKVDAETAREVIGRYHALLRSTAEHHRAGVTKYIGDGFMAVWGVPEIGPDDAAHAVEAAVELQELFVDLAAQVSETHGVELALRVAVNTGEVVVGAGDADLVGDALNIGARLEAECPRGHVVVGEETWRSTRGRHTYESLGQVQVKGRTAPVAIYQWLDRQSEPADAAPFVGRADEVRRLQAVLDDAVAVRAARLVTVIGDPGVGKSRLAAEFTGAQPNAHIVEARCDVEGTVALAPIVEVLRSRDLESDVPASVPDRERLLRDLNGLTAGVAGSVEENFWALRRFVEVLASDGPVLLILDDIQWADSLLLDFLEHLVEWVQEAPLLVLALARPELREIRPDLVTVSQWVSEAVHLDGLDAGATAELAAKVLGATQLPDELLRRLPSSTGGNPLFVRELIGMLAHDGVLVEQPAGWRLTIDVDAIAIPPTIHALLASRLERLDAGDRRILEIASVVGSDFSLGTVRALADSGAEGIMLSLNRLRRLELAQPSGSYIGDEPVWRFHHVLIRDVAYRRLLKSDRAHLHEQLADWVEAGGPSVAFETDEMIARHLEAAHTYRLELGMLDEHTGDLALRSARHYAASARRALDRDELISAGTQAARGAALARADDEVHAELLLVGCEAFLSAGDVAAGAPLVDDLERIADEALAPWATCYRCQFVIYTDPERLLEVDTRLQGAIDEFGRRADPAGLSKAHRVRAGARARLGRIGDCEADLFEALIAARQSGDHRQITVALGAAPSAALWGPSPVPKAGGRCLDVVRMQRMTTAAPSLEATSLRHLAVLELLRGRPDKARTMLADARQIVAELGLRHGLMETELFAGIIESMEGDPVAAEPHFRTAVEGLDALGVGADAGQAAAFLARSVLAQGRIDEADRHATESERLAGRNLKTTIAWRAVRAEILAAQGRHDEAAAMAREAVAVAAGTDLVLDHADACLALSRVLAAAGDTKGANDTRDDADRLYAAKEVASTIGREFDRVVAAASPPVPAEAAPTTSRLTLKNRASQTVDGAYSALQARDVDGMVATYSERLVYDDRRRLGGNPVDDLTVFRAAVALFVEQYSRVEWRTLAVRGERLSLVWTRGSNDAGFETTQLHVHEVGDDGRIVYEGRFDEDDFEGANRELERRYYAGEGAAFAEAGLSASEAPIAINRDDFDRFSELTNPDMHIENQSSTAFPDRSASDVRATFEDLHEMVDSVRTWISAVCWLSPVWSVTRMEREAVGRDGEQYAWTRVIVSGHRNGRIASMCLFELEDEEAAFAYCEERVRASTSRLAVTNRASETEHALFTAMRAHNVDGVMRCCSDRLVYEDRRRLSGDLLSDSAAIRAAMVRILEQYSSFEWRSLAVRGDHLSLHWSRWSDTAGNETAYLHVSEVGDDGRIDYECRFDEDDFESAYRELEGRYYAGEGAAFAEAGATAIEYAVAVNQGDYDRLFGELSTPEMRVENRSRSAFPDRPAADFRASFEDLDTIIASARSWLSAVDWVSPTCGTGRHEREAVGEDGAQYAWTRLVVFEIRDRRMASMCMFELDDEAAAFAYAEERVRASASRLAVTNKANETVDASWQAMHADDIDRVLWYYSETFVYDDRRRISGDPVVGLDAMRSGMERLHGQYPHIEWRTLAVRGERLVLRWSRPWDDAGNEATGLQVFEVDRDARIEYQGRFDEDDFEGAYGELERRYYAGEGAAFAEAGALTTEYAIAVNQGDLEQVFGTLTAPGFRVENRSRSAFPDRSAAELRATFEDLTAMVASSRTWNSVLCWLSPNWCVGRNERQAVGRDGEQYAWARIYVFEVRDGRMAALCEFDIEDEAAAFGYAEERMRATASRLAVTNRSCETMHAFITAMRAHDVDGGLTCFSEEFVYDDRRQLSGDPVRGKAELRAAGDRILKQYSRFEWRTLAVRGDRLILYSSRWSDDAGNETGYLHVFEIGDDGLICCESRFDENDFDGAYRELDRRYYTGEGAEFADAGAAQTEWLAALNRGDLDRLFGELTAPELRFEMRSSSAFPDRSAGEARAFIEDFNAMIASAQIWHSSVCWVSPTCCVTRNEREALGRDGEQYTWTRLSVVEFRDGRMTSECEFDLDDEDAAFAYAEERVHRAEHR